MNETIKAIMTRSSVRKYTAQQLSGEQKKAIIDCALAAPSGANIQPWHFCVVEDKNRILEMESDLVERVMQSGDEVAKNRVLSRNKKLLFDAPFIVFVTVPQKYAANGVDCGIAIENMVIAAESMGLSSIVLAGIRTAFQEGDKTEYYAKLMGFPEGNIFVAAVAIGYAAEKSAPHQLDHSKVSYV